MKKSEKKKSRWDGQLRNHRRKEGPPLHKTMRRKAETNVVGKHHE